LEINEALGGGLFVYVPPLSLSVVASSFFTMSSWKVSWNAKEPV
jgi:hypothetical protein